MHILIFIVPLYNKTDVGSQAYKYHNAILYYALLLTSAVAECPPQHIFDGRMPGSQHFTRLQFASREQVFADALEYKRRTFSKMSKQITTKIQRQNAFAITKLRPCYLHHMPYVKSMGDRKIAAVNKRLIQLPDT